MTQDWFQRGEAAFDKGNLDEAESCFAEHLKKHPDAKVAINNLCCII